MTKKERCEITQDLLPSYVEGLTSTSSNLFIQGHLKSCRSCREACQSMTASMPAFHIPKEEVNYLKRFYRILRRSLLFAGILLLTLALTCGIFFWYLLTGGFPSRTSDPGNYGAFQNFRALSTLEIFPEEIPASAKTPVYSYYFRDTWNTPVYEIYLECSYSQADYEKETARLAQLHTDWHSDAPGGYEITSQATIQYDTESFLYPCYLASDGYLQAYEYALLDASGLRIIYISVQNMPKEKISFPAAYLPSDYMDSEKSGGYSIYNRNDAAFIESTKRQ